MVVLAFTFIGCGATSMDNVITLTVWGAEEDQALLRELCSDYAKANPNKQYNFLFGVQAEGDALNNLLNDIQAGPDVFSFASDQINSFISAGALARIGGDIESAVKSENSEASIDSATVNMGGEDRLYAYPTTGDNCYFLYYNKAVYTDESKVLTLDGLLEVASAKGKQVHFRLNEDGWYLSSFFFAQPELKYEVTYDEQMNEKAVSINYNNAKGLQVMKALANYVANPNFVVKTDDAKMLAGVRDGSISAFVTGTWNATAVKQAWGDNLGVMKLPTATIGGEQKQLISFFGFKLLGVNNYSSNKSEAHKLAQFLTNEQSQLKRFNARGFAPTNKVVADMEQVKSNQVISAVYAQAEFSRTQKGVPSSYWSPMASLITPIVAANGTGFGDATLQGYLDSFVSAVRK